MEAGHEIGCHSYAHQLIYELTPATFREGFPSPPSNAAEVQPRLYQAPSYSITGQSMWALEILVECGFLRFQNHARGP